MKTKNFTFELFFAWYDIWIGLYVDKKNDCVYICLIPMVVIKIERRAW